MFNLIYDDSHKIRQVIDGNFKKVKLRSNSEYESGLLCSDCDGGILSALETYASKVIYHAGSLNKKERIKTVLSENQDGIQFLNVADIDYYRFSSFLLSLLWRSSISSRPFFKEVNLNKEFEEILRQRILNPESNKWDEIPIMLWSFSHSKSITDHVVIQPRFQKNSAGVDTIVFTINGLIITYHLIMDEGKLLPRERSICFKPNESLKILLIPESHTFKIVSALMGKK